MFIPALFITVKRLKQPNVLKGWMDRHTYDGKLNSNTCHNMGEPWRHPMWSKSVTKRQQSKKKNPTYIHGRHADYTETENKTWLPGVGRKGHSLMGIMCQYSMINF